MSLRSRLVCPTWTMSGSEELCLLCCYAVAHACISLDTARNIGREQFLELKWAGILSVRALLSLPSSAVALATSMMTARRVPADSACCCLVLKFLGNGRTSKPKPFKNLEYNSVSKSIKPIYPYKLYLCSYSFSHFSTVYILLKYCIICNSHESIL